MIVVDRSDLGHELMEKVRRNSPEREPGLHVSDLIYCARKAWARINGYERVETDDDTLTFLLGRGWHGVLEGEGGEISVRLLEQEVYGTVDFVDVAGRPVELKTTRKGSGRPLTDMNNYIEQAAAYCIALGSTSCIIHVVHISGNYHPPKPELKSYQVHFEGVELEAWKVELVRRKAAILSLPNMPDLSEHYTWECDRCPVKEAIGCPGGKGSRDVGFFGDMTPPWNTLVVEEK